MTAFGISTSVRSTNCMPWCSAMAAMTSLAVRYCCLMMASCSLMPVALARLSASASWSGPIIFFLSRMSAKSPRAFAMMDAPSVKPS